MTVTPMIPQHAVRIAASAGCLIAALLGTAGCGLLDVEDPTAIVEEELTNADGAQLLRGDALRRWYLATAQSAVASGVLTDEYFADAFFGWYEVLDRRASEALEQQPAENSSEAPTRYQEWLELRHAATHALPMLRAYAPPGAKEADLGEMFALRAFGALRVAEDFCPGFPLHDIVNNKPVISPPLSTDQALERALTDFDSALVYAADSARILHFTRVGRARTLLGLGRFADAGTAVALVPTGYVANAEYVAGSTSTVNRLAGNARNITWGVSDREGGSGLDFVSAGDPRVQTFLIRTASDSVTPIYGAAKYTTEADPVVVASGIEARLIEAEAALNESDGAWLTILNELRTTCTDAATCPDPAPAGTGGVGSLPPLEDPGTVEARVDLLFRERAFWLFSTGHRLADLRRLVTWYGRSPESVFPSGSYWSGGAYSTGTSLPFPGEVEAEYNPDVTGCTSR